MEETDKKRVSIRLDKIAYDFLRKRAFDNYQSINSALNQILIELSEEENKEAGESQLAGTDSPALHMNQRRNT